MPPYDVEKQLKEQTMESVLCSLKSLQTSREYSDLIIVCGDKTFQVHRAIICPRSKYFATSCRWSQDGKVKEEIKLDDDDPSIVGLMLDYLYQMDYNDLLPSKDATPSTEGNSPDRGQAEVVSPVGNSQAAWNPDLDPVGTISEPGHGHSYNNSEPRPMPESHRYIDYQAELLRGTDEEWHKRRPRNFGTTKYGRKEMEPEVSVVRPDCENVHTARLTVNTLVYAMADKYEIDGLKDLAKAKFTDAAYQDWKTPAFAYAAELVSNTTPSSGTGLRGIVVKTIERRRELISCDKIRNLLDSGNGMAWALVQVLLGRDEVLDRLELSRCLPILCPSCRSFVRDRLEFPHLH